MNSINVEELDCGNCEIARFHGKEADVKSVSPRTETCYQAAGMDELAQHSEVQSSVPLREFSAVKGSVPESGIYTVRENGGPYRHGAAGTD
jgi:hypothetical protein